MGEPFRMKRIIKDECLNKSRGELMKVDLKSKIKITFIFLVLLTSINIVAAQSNFDEYKPYLHNPSVGQVPELETFGEYNTELFPGAGTYEYTLKLPQGTLGLQPLLSFRYNSQSSFHGSSVLGNGWSLTENSIVRNVNHTIEDTSDDYFILTFNNNRLKVYYNGSNYNSEINPNQYRIQNLSNGANEYWLITTANGVKYRFGFNDDSLMESNLGYEYDSTWSLDLVQDIHNNSITYSYLENPFAEDAGSVYIANITYNNDNKRFVDFEYESQARPDRRLVFAEGNMVDQSRRLAGVSVYFDSSLVSRYSIEYEDLNSEQSLSSISNITYFGSDNSSSLAPVIFDYYDTMQGFDNLTNNWIVPESFAFSSTDLTGKDFGVRLLDVNNDGFPDLIKAKSGETKETRLNNKIDGWNTTSDFVMPENIVDGSNLDQGVRFQDVNSDGLLDILKARDGTKNVYLNNGTGWYDATSNWTIPVDFINGDNDNLGVNLADANGDGKVDILQASTSVSQVYLNNGTGWVNASGWNLPDNFVDGDNKDTGLRIVELNGDGLPDFIKGGMPGEAWLNNGTGWVAESNYAPELDFVDHDDRPDLGVRFMDINGDGLQDILQNFLSNVSYVNQTCIDNNGTEQNCTEYTITSDTNTKLNNGTGWVAGIGWLSPEKFADQGFNIGRRIADINGDGYADIIVAYEESPFLGITHIENATNAFLLKQITNSYGGKTDISYTQSTLSDNSDDLGFNIWLVDQTNLNNSLTGDFAAGSQYSYLYNGGLFDYQNQEFRGFARVNETSPDSSVIAHYFHQEDVLKGREYKTSVYDVSNNLVTENFNYFSESEGIISLDQVSTLIYDDSGNPEINNISYTYDAYNNIESVNNTGKISLEGDEKFESFDYEYNLVDFVVNRPVNYSLIDNNGEIIKQTSYFYDGLSSGVDKGDLTKQVNYNNNGEDPAFEYTYDSFGNVIQQTNPRGYNTTYVYDSTGAYVLSETNPLSHVINYVYDEGTGNLLSEVRDGLNNTFTYDVFGRIENEIISPDTSSYPTKTYTYMFDGIAPEIIKLENKNSDGDYSESLYFYDGFSNPVQVKLLFDTNIQAVQSYFYDSKYRIDEEQNAYLDSYSTNLSSSNESTINYEYDSLDRVINLTKQDGNSINIDFNGTLVTQYDENSNRIDYVLDGLDRIVGVLEYNGAEIYTTNYTYREDGKLVKIVDANGNEFLFGYDSLGRKTVFDDPNMNNWTYSYDLNGNLINQTDGRNITTTILYDEIDRPTFKYSNLTNITFTYDSQFNGTLSQIHSVGTYYEESDGIDLAYVYDNRLRIIEEKTNLCFRIGVSSQCEWINVTVDYDSQNRVLNKYLPHDNLSYQYNDIGKIENINDFVNSINYNAFGGAVNKSYTNNLVTEIDYDELNRISQIQTESLQNLSYDYDAVGNIALINDTENSKAYAMEYDALNRLTETIIYDYILTDHEKFSYVYDAIGNLLSSTTDSVGTNLTYGDLAHTPINVTSYDRLSPNYEFNTIYPTSDISVTQGEFFNYSTQICCTGNDCWGTDVYLDPQDEGFTENSETVCDGFTCNKIIYSATRFVFEDEEWKKIENARSLKNVWDVNIDLDERFPAEVIDYNYTSIILNLSTTDLFRFSSVPLKVYSRDDSNRKPLNELEEEVNKDRSLSVGRNEREIITIDLSDTQESLLTQEIKWGDASTIITVYDNNSANLADTYIRDGTYDDENYGSSPFIYIVNSTGGNTERRIIIDFDTSQIPRQAIVEEASLNMWLENNGLDTGESMNVSVYQFFDHFEWDEGTITWNNGPNETDYNNTAFDEKYIPGGSGKPNHEYLEWDVSNIIKQKNDNESFYLYANIDDGAEGGDTLLMKSKEHPSQNERPFLNVTYLLKGIIPMNSSETPFYTNVSNPYHLDLEKDQCEDITWWVNATGEKRDYLFFAFANKTSNGTVYSESELVEITIV